MASFLICLQFVGLMMIMTLKKRVRREIKCFKRLWLIRKENRWSALAHHLIFRWMGSKKPRQLSVGGKQIWLRPATTDAIVAVSSLVRGEFDSVTRYKDAENCKFIIDAGSYIGTAALAFSERFPAALIVCIEPSPENYAMLRKNIEGYPRIVSLNSALLGLKRPIRLYDKMTGEWGYTVVAPKGAADSSSTDFGPVEGVTVDDIMRMYEADKIDIFKLDIEGTEKEILENSGTWIDKCDVIIAELHDRYVAGCSAAYATATSHMEQVKNIGEKRLAVRLSGVPNFNEVLGQFHE